MSFKITADSEAVFRLTVRSSPLLAAMGRQSSFSKSSGGGKGSVVHYHTHHHVQKTAVSVPVHVRVASAGGCKGPGRPAITAPRPSAPKPQAPKTAAASRAVVSPRASSSASSKSVAKKAPSRAAAQPKLTAENFTVQRQTQVTTKSSGFHQVHHSNEVISHTKITMTPGSAGSKSRR